MSEDFDKDAIKPDICVESKNDVKVVDVSMSDLEASAKKKRNLYEKENH